MKEYSITTVNDLLQLDCDQLSDCLRDLEYAINLHCLAYGERAKDVGLKSIVWRDDKSHSVSLADVRGDEFLTLHVTDNDA